MHARSFAQLAADPHDDWTEAYAEYYGNVYRFSNRVLWGGPWKLVFNHFDMDELYNLDDDPRERINLAALDEHQPRVEAMMRRIWQIMRDTGDVMADHHYPGARLAAVGPLP